MRRLVIALLVCLACATPLRLPQSPDELEEGQRLVAGKVITTFKETDHRLFIYLRTEDDIVVAIAKNAEKSKLLDRLQAKLNGNDQVVVLFGLEVNRWEEYVDGIDMEVVLVSYYDKHANRAMVVFTQYGDNVRALLGEVDWGNVASDIVKRAAKAAVP